MTMQEPKVEFEKIDLEEKVVASSGGGQYCKASQPEAKECADYDTQTPW